MRHKRRVKSVQKLLHAFGTSFFSWNNLRNNLIEFLFVSDVPLVR